MRSICSKSSQAVVKSRRFSEPKQAYCAPAGAGTPRYPSPLPNTVDTSGFIPSERCTTSAHWSIRPATCQSFETALKYTPHTGAKHPPISSVSCLKRQRCSGSDRPAATTPLSFGSVGKFETTKQTCRFGPTVTSRTSSTSLRGTPVTTMERAFLPWCPSRGRTCSGS